VPVSTASRMLPLMRHNDELPAFRVEDHERLISICVISRNIDERRETGSTFQANHVLRRASAIRQGAGP
jgi:hypothetical protein